MKTKGPKETKGRKTKGRGRGEEKEEEKEDGRKSYKLSQWFGNNPSGSRKRTNPREAKGRQPLEKQKTDNRREDENRTIERRRGAGGREEGAPRDKKI